MDIFIFKREKFAAAAKARLNFIDNKQDVVFFAEPCASRKYPSGGRTISRFAFELVFNKKRSSVSIDGSFQFTNVAILHNREAGVNGPKPFLYCASVEKLMIVVVRPWKLSVAQMISALYFPEFLSRYIPTSAAA